MAKRLLAVVLVLIVLASGCIGSKKSEQTTATQTIAAAGPYTYKLSESEVGDSWKMIWEAKNMAGWNLDQQKEFAADGITDAAGWTFVRGNETIYIWARDFAINDDLVKVESKKIHVTPYAGSVDWKEVTELPQYGDIARVGVFGAKETANLFLYLAQNNTMLFIQYTNQAYNGYPRYEKELVTGKSNLFADKRFLIGLAKKMLAKPATASP